MTQNKNDFSFQIQRMEDSILEHLSHLEIGYGERIWSIEESTGIPRYLLTAILKNLKNENKIDLIMLFSESTGLANGSGYCLKGHLNK